MKAKMIALTSLTAVALIFFASVNAVQAGSGSKHNRHAEISAATARLDNISRELERTISYSAPVLSDESFAFETEAAAERLDEMAAVLEADAAYVAPRVSDDAELLEAVENLEDLNVRMNWSLAYVAPSVTE